MILFFTTLCQRQFQGEPYCYKLQLKQLQLIEFPALFWSKSIGNTISPDSDPLHRIFMLFRISPLIFLFRIMRALILHDVYVFSYVQIIRCLQRVSPAMALLFRPKIHKSLLLAK